MQTDTTERLLTFVARTFKTHQAGTSLSPASPLFSSRLIDSMGLIELIAFIEREFGVVLEATVEELTALDTIERLASEIDRLRKAKQA